jgi:hypothetical protein
MPRGTSLLPRVDTSDFMSRGASPSAFGARTYVEGETPRGIKPVVSEHYMTFSVRSVLAGNQLKEGPHYHFETNSEHFAQTHQTICVLRRG